MTPESEQQHWDIEARTTCKKPAITVLKKAKCLLLADDMSLKHIFLTAMEVDRGPDHPRLLQIG